METEHIITPEVAMRAGARMREFQIACWIDSDTGEWTATVIGLMILPTRPVAAGGKGVPTGKRTNGFEARGKDPVLAVQMAMDACRRAYASVRALSPTTPLAG